VYTAAEESGKTIAHKTYVTQGMSYNGTVEITAGLAQGSKVVTTGHLNLTEGALINY
jgi:hypothetical protein